MHTLSVVSEEVSETTLREFPLQFMHVPGTTKFEFSIN